MHSKSRQIRQKLLSGNRVQIEPEGGKGLRKLLRAFRGYRGNRRFALPAMPKNGATCSCQV